MQRRRIFRHTNFKIGIGGAAPVWTLPCPINERCYNIYERLLRRILGGIIGALILLFYLYKEQHRRLTSKGVALSN